MGNAATLISVDEYLNTSYEPDMEFVHGVLVERNVGEQPHGDLQGIVYAYFREFRKSHGIKVFPETRLRIEPLGAYRVPDVLVLEKPYKKGKAVEDVPAIVVEVNSPTDRFADIVEKCFEYENLGVANILVMDPTNRHAWLFREGSLQLLTGPSVGLTLPRQQLTLDIPFTAMFAELDED